MEARTRFIVISLVVVVLAAGLYLLMRPVIKANEHTSDVVIQNGQILDIGLATLDAADPGVLKWKFGSSSATGYVFPDKSASAPGIVFKGATPPSTVVCTRVLAPGDADYAIHNCDAKQAGSEFHCNVKKGKVGDCYAYTVTVVSAPSSSASAVPPLDPWFKQQ